MHAYRNWSFPFLSLFFFIPFFWWPWAYGAVEYGVHVIWPNSNVYRKSPQFQLHLFLSNCRVIVCARTHKNTQSLTITTAKPMIGLFYFATGKKMRSHPNRFWWLIAALILVIASNPPSSISPSLFIPNRPRYRTPIY